MQIACPNSLSGCQTISTQNTHLQKSPPSHIAQGKYYFEFSDWTNVKLFLIKIKLTIDLIRKDSELKGLMEQQRLFIPGADQVVAGIRFVLKMSLPFCILMIRVMSL